ncbi:ATP-binding protein [Streptomyces sp. NPDC059063]|uniref:ATP-binding protein n=1 Tax=unclassified Streptomyces TaxID=2593676 RepID=UPI0036C77132
MFRRRFPATRRAARLARVVAVRQVEEWGERSETVAAVVAELAANAVLHAQVPGRNFEVALLWVPGGPLRVEVTDTCGDRAPGPQAELPSLEAESGRGLVLVETLASRWGVAVGPAPRKTVWAELE